MNVLRSLEALLFVADSPARPEELAQAIGCPVFEVEEALETLGRHLEHSTSLQLVRIAGGFQICTKAEFAEIVAKFTKPQTSKLTRSLMEVLAIVAYQQPVTSAEIDAVRGVDSSYALRQLLDRRLLTEVGRKKSPGRPLLYGTTQQFLHVFKLEDLAQLPPIDKSLPPPVPSTESDQPVFSLE
ncbi:MAG: SMC-Scp complex subunit ScpB [Armatimonadetes bacterium]|nr:SMC-Scp complex subunit ScpB [Armatimonadota bacterium]